MTIVDSIEGNSGREHRLEALTEDFFVSLARHGVRALAVMMRGTIVDFGPALAFGFAEPTSGGWRRITGARCASGADFLEQVRRVRELALLFGIDFSIV